MSLVCPECGNGEVETTLTTRTSYTYTLDGNPPQLVEATATVEDGGDLGDADEFTCTDCGETFERPEEEMVTQEAYDADLAEAAEYREMAAEIIEAGR